MNSEKTDNIITQVPATPVLEMLQRGEIDIQIQTAKRWPRSIDEFKQTAISMATLDEETAAACFYALPRGGKNIEGPSARLAEIVVSAWKNIRAGTRIIDIDDKFVTAQAVCHDLECNVAIAVETKRRITDRGGRRYNDDLIGVTANAAASIALRNSVFKVIPMAFVKAVYQAARQVAIGDASTLVNKRAAVVDYFQKMGVAKERLLAVVGRKSLEDVGLEQLAILKGLATAIKDGDTTVDQAFPAVGTVSVEHGSRAEQVGAAVKAAAAVAKPNKPEPAKPTAAKTPEDPKKALRDKITKALLRLPREESEKVMSRFGVKDATGLESLDSETLNDLRIAIEEATKGNV